MVASSLDEELRALLLRAGICAPSMHNTQPWLFRVRGSCIEVYRDPSRELPVEDPDDRAVLISHGAVCFNIRTAAAYAGFGMSVHVFPEAAQPTLVARLLLERPWHEDVAPLAALYSSIPLRRTNRMPYAEVRLAEEAREELCAAARAEGADLEWVRDRSRVMWLLRLASDAELEDAYDPLRISEQSQWIGGVRDTEGMPEDSLPLRPAEPGAPVRDFLTGNRKTREIGEYERDPAIAVLTTRADQPADRILAGMALQRVWLTATARGVAVSPLTGAIEHRSLRWLIRDPLTGWSEPQSILRFGYGPAVEPTPRRPLAEFLIVEMSAGTLKSPRRTALGFGRPTAVRACTPGDWALQKRSHLFGASHQPTL